MPPILRRSSHAVLLLALLLAGCTGISVQPTPEQEQQRVEQARALAEQGRLEEALTAWRELAATAPPARASDYRLRAAELLVDADRLEDVPALLEGLEGVALEGLQAERLAVLQAALALDAGRTYAALRSLPEATDALPPGLQARILELRARGMVEIGNPVEAARLRIARSPVLGSPEAVEANQLALWDALSRLSDSALDRLLLADELETGLRGWLQLARVYRQAQNDPDRLAEGLDRWTLLYPAHPAADAFTFRLLEEARRSLIRPRRIALMLPLAGRLADAGEAVQQGFLAAWYEDGTGQRPEIEIIDAGVDPANLQLRYLQAIEGGADMVVGPLSKPDVQALREVHRPDIPVLTLNYDDDPEPRENLFEFGLLPEDEARQAAMIALQEGHDYAVTLAPETEWGERVTRAFTRRFESLGGRVLTSGAYDPQQSDFSAPIRRLLNLDASETRYRTLRIVLGLDIEFEPRRRRDIDMLFLAANPRQARLIRPQIKFHHAADLPVIATSHVSGTGEDTRADRDLDGLIYTAMPWTLWSTRQQEYARLQDLWPKSMARYARLYALGLDAYRIIPYLRRLQSRPNERFPGHTGNLWVDAAGRVHRDLLVATFDAGERRLVTPVQEPGPDGGQVDAQGDGR